MIGAPKKSSVEFWSFLSMANMVSDSRYIESCGFAAWFSREFTLCLNLPPFLKLLDNFFIKEKLRECGPCVRQITVAGLVQMNAQLIFQAS